MLAIATVSSSICHRCSWRLDLSLLLLTDTTYCGSLPTNCLPLQHTDRLLKMSMHFLQSIIAYTYILVVRLLHCLRVHDNNTSVRNWVSTAIAYCRLLLEYWLQLISTVYISMKNVKVDNLWEVFVLNNSLCVKRRKSQLYMAYHQKVFYMKESKN